MTKQTRKNAATNASAKSLIYCSSDSKAPLKPKVAEELSVGLH
jgi:hypothetical protein